MAKKLKRCCSFAVGGWKANPRTACRSALAGFGINIAAFWGKYNAHTSNRVGDVIPAEIGDN